MNKFEALSQLSAISEDHEKQFNDFIKELKIMDQILDEYPEYAGYILSLSAELSANKGFNLDIEPTLCQLYAKAANHCSDEEVLNIFKYTLKKNSRFAFNAMKQILPQKPNLAKNCFDLMLGKVQNLDANELYRANSGLLAAIVHSPENEIPQMINNVFSSENHGLKKIFYASLSEIYKKHPSLEKDILQHLIAHRDSLSNNDIAYFDNIGNMALCNPDFHKTALKLIGQKIQNKNLSPDALGKSFKAIENILTTGDGKDKASCMHLLKIGLKHPLIQRRDQIRAYKLLGDVEKLKSLVTVFSRGEKTEDNTFGMNKVQNDVINNPCVLVLGGDGTRTEKLLNGYLSNIYRLLKENNLHEKVGVYGVVYDFGEYMNVNMARTYQMEKYGRNVHLKKEIPQDTIDPKYITEIFNKFILGRISADNGQTKIEAEQAAENIRQLNIVAHCHGAYTALKLEEMMQKKMVELGYSKSEMAYIQKQLLILAQSPYCPLGQSKSTFISYAVVADDEVCHYNNFENSIRKLNEKKAIPLSYFPDRQGNIFLVSSMGPKCEQHNFWGYSPSEDMSKEGKSLVLMAAKILVNGVKNSLKPGGRLTEVENLLVENETEKSIFAKISENGQKIYKAIIADTIARKKLRAEKNQRL